MLSTMPLQRPLLDHGTSGQQETAPMQASLNNSLESDISLEALITSTFALNAFRLSHQTGPLLWPRLEDR